MKSKLESKLSMLHSVQLHLNENASVWSNLPAFKDAHDDLEALMKEIEKTGEFQSNSRTGITKDKNQAKDELIEKIIIVKGKVKAYAAKKGNKTLQASVEV